MMRHRTNQEVLAEVDRVVIGDHVFSTYLGCALFIVRLGRGDVEVLRHGFSEFVPVIKNV